MNTQIIAYSNPEINSERQFQRSQQPEDTGGKISHDECGEGFPKGEARSPGRTIGGEVKKVANSQGLEAIGSILRRLSFIEESPEQEQLNLFTSEPKPKVGEIQLKDSCCCGSRFGRTGAGRKPGEASLHCAQCRKFIQWIGASELKSVRKNTLL